MEPPPPGQAIAQRGVLGGSVFDTATVTGTPAASTPAGTVTYEFFTNGTGSGTPAATQTVTLNADGTVPDSAVQGPLAAGAYSFIAVYSGDSNYTGSTSAVEPLTISQGSTTTATAILDAATRQAPSGVLGESVFDTATVTGSPAAFTPTGTVTYEFFTNGTGSGMPASMQTVTLNANGTVPDSAIHGPLAAGAYSFIAVYSGDGNYQGSASAVEPLTINQGTSSTATTILDAATNLAPTGVLGESVYDTATVTTTPKPFTATGTVTYEFFTNGSGSGAPASTQTVTLVNGVVPNSSPTGPLMAGAYSFIAVYSGDGNYQGSTSAVEPLTINQGTSSTATTILDAGGGAPTGVLGESVYDTATVMGSAAFTPTGTVTYEFFTTLDGTGPHTDQTVDLVNGAVPNSSPTGPLAAGAYSFIAVYSGDGNYNGSASPVEPLTINKGASSTATTILDATTGQLPSGVLGESVFDTATVTGTPAAFAPTGTVTYEFFANGTGAGAPVSTETVTLNADGTVPNSAAHGPLAAGAYSFIAIYSGDGNYTGSTSPVEPLTISQGSTATATEILDATTGQPPSGVLGESVYDTATVTGTPAAFAATGTVTYEFFANGTGAGPHGLDPDGDLERRRHGAQLGGARSAGGRRLQLHRHLQRRRQLHRQHQSRRAADHQPGQQRHGDRDPGRHDRPAGQRRAGRVGVRHGDGDGDAGGLHADGDGDLRVLRQRHGHRPAGLDPDGDAERRRHGAQLGGARPAGGRRLQLHRHLQRRRQLHGQHQPGRAADHQPGQHRHGDRDPGRHDRPAAQRRSGRVGVRHGDGDGDAAGLRADGDGDLRVLQQRHRHRAARSRPRR